MYPITYKNWVFLLILMIPLISSAQFNSRISVIGPGSSYPTFGDYNIPNTLPKDTDSQVSARLLDLTGCYRDRAQFFISSDPYWQVYDKELTWSGWLCGGDSKHLTIEGTDLSNGTFGNKAYIIYTWDNQLVKVHSFDLVNEADHEIKLTVTKFPTALDTRIQWSIDDLGFMETQRINLTVRLIDFQTGEIRIIYNSEVPTTYHTAILSSSGFSNSNHFDLMVVEVYPRCTTSHCIIKTGQNTVNTSY